MTALNEEIPYLLTRDDEETAVMHEIKEISKHKIRKMTELGYSIREIEAKMKELNISDEIDRIKVFNDANERKHLLLWQKDQDKKRVEDEKREKEALKNFWSARQVYDLIKFESQNTYGKDFIKTEWNKDLISAVCLFISMGDNFEKKLGFSLNKGLWIHGTVGVGKTYIFQCAARNEYRPIKIYSMVDIADDIKHHGEFGFERGVFKIFYLDDVGTEEATINHYGTKINWFKDFIETTYATQKVFNNIVVSTNCSFDEIGEKYGFRVRSRIKDMFNIVDVDGLDMRGK